MLGHVGACMLGHVGACMLGHVGACMLGHRNGDRNGWPLTMTVALPQQANLPRSRACQRECQSVRGWLGTARGCGPRLALCSNSSAVRRVARVAASGSRPAGAGRGQRLTLQLPSCSPTAHGSRRKGSGPVRSGRSGRSAFRPPDKRPANFFFVPASPEQGARDVRPAASKGQICPAAGRHEVPWSLPHTRRTSLRRPLPPVQGPWMRPRPHFWRVHPSPHPRHGHQPPQRRHPHTCCTVRWLVGSKGSMLPSHGRWHVHPTTHACAWLPPTRMAIP